MTRYEEATKASWCALARLDPHLERCTIHNPVDDVRKAVVVRPSNTHDRADARHVLGRQSAAERVSQQLLGQRLHEYIRLFKQRVPQFAGTGDLGAIDEN